jgi:hypothetical protein
VRDRLERVDRVVSGNEIDVGLRVVGELAAARATGDERMGIWLRDSVN